MSQDRFEFLAEDTAETDSHGGESPVRDLSPRRTKRIQITTLEAYYRLLPTLPERERAVLCALQRYYTRRPNRWPTAYELFQFMRQYEQNVFDINSVRPVLTRLKDKGIVEFGGRTACTITQQSAYSWRLVERLQYLLGGVE